MLWHNDGGLGLVMENTFMHMVNNPYYQSRGKTTCDKYVKNAIYKYDSNDVMYGVILYDMYEITI